jgi:hypothetical protein
MRKSQPRKPTGNHQASQERIKHDACGACWFYRRPAYRPKKWQPHPFEESPSIKKSNKQTKNKKTEKVKK